MYIANDNNCWFTNVGEAFIDIGVKSLVDKICRKDPDIHFGTVSPMSFWYMSNLRSSEQISTYELQERHNDAKSRSLDISCFCPDVLLLPGMFACREFYESHHMTYDYAKTLVKNGGGSRIRWSWSGKV